MVTGAYVKIGEHISAGLEKGTMLVEAVSQTQLRVQIQGTHTIQVDDILHVRFHLATAPHPAVNRLAVVTGVEASCVTAAWLSFAT